jgi:hypothetical protein
MTRSDGPSDNPRIVPQWRRSHDGHIAGMARGGHPSRERRGTQSRRVSGSVARGAFQVLAEFPLAVVTCQVAGRKAGEEYVRVPEMPKDLAAPVVAAFDIKYVLEDAEFAAGCGEVVVFKAVDKGGDAARGVVGAGVGEEDVMRFWSDGRFHANR